MSPLNCSEFDRLADELIESRQSLADDRLRDHAAACDGCRARWDEHALLEFAIPAWKSSQETTDVADAVLARWAFSREPRRPALAPKSARNDRRRGMFALVATSAAVLVMAVLLVQDRRATELSPGDQIAMLVPDDLHQPDDIGDNSDASPRGIIREAGAAYLSLAEEAGRALADAAVLVPSAAGDVEFRSNPPNADAAGSSARGWSDGLSPIGDNVGKAVDFLLDAFPSDPAPTT